MHIPVKEMEFLTGVADSDLSTHVAERGRLLSYVAYARSLRHLLIREKPDVLHLHSSFAGLIGRLVARSVSHPITVIYCAHGWSFMREGPLWKSHALAAVERVLSGLCNAIVCISKSDFDGAVRFNLPRENLVTITNGVSAPVGRQLHYPKEFDRSRLNALFVGRFDEQKGFETYISLARRFGTEGMDWWAVGDYVLGSKYFDVRLDPVTTLGWKSREALESYYQFADVVVMPSRWEGFGLVAVEAARHKTPVIASDIGGLSEIIEDGVTGFLAPRGQLLNALERFSHLSPADRAEMGRAAKRRYEKLYTADRMNVEIISLYRKSVLGAQQIK